MKWQHFLPLGLPVIVFFIWLARLEVRMVWLRQDLNRAREAYDLYIKGQAERWATVQNLLLVIEGKVSESTGKLAIIERVLNNRAKNKEKP